MEIPVYSLRRRILNVKDNPYWYEIHFRLCFKYRKNKNDGITINTDTYWNKFHFGYKQGLCSCSFHLIDILCRSMVKNIKWVRSFNYWKLYIASVNKKSCSSYKKSMIFLLPKHTPLVQKGREGSLQSASTLHSK